MSEKIDENEGEIVNKTPKPNTRRVINFRISPEEESMLTEACKALGVNRSVFFRKAIRDSYHKTDGNSITVVADGISKSIAPDNSGIVKHPFAKLVMTKGIDVNLEDGTEKNISTLTDLFDFLQRYVFTKS